MSLTIEFSEVKFFRELPGSCEGASSQGANFTYEGPGEAGSLNREAASQGLYKKISTSFEFLTTSITSIRFCHQ